MSGRWSALTHGSALNLAACLALLVGGLLELGTLHYSSPESLAVTSCVVCTLAPTLGRRYPATSALLAVAAVTTYQGLTDDPNGGFVAAATMLACFYLGRDYPDTGSVRRLVGVVGLALPAVVAATVSDHHSASGALGTWFLLVVVPTAVGKVAYRRHGLLTRLEQAAETLQLAKLRAGDVAGALERTRVARELHDVVAHYVSVMVIQAGAARTVCTANPAVGRDALEAVEAAGRRALEELRRALGALRHDTDSAIDLTRIQQLCESVRAAGVRTTLTATDVSDLTVDSAQAAYRIVQEALTNVARHAPGAQATIAIRRKDDEVEIVVADDGGTSPGHPSFPPGGHGLVGMAERASWVGGSVEAGPLPEGGFRVAARLPVRPSVALPSDAAGHPLWSPTAAVGVVSRHCDLPTLQRLIDPAGAVVFAMILGIDAGLRATGSARVPSIVLGVVLGGLVRWRRRGPMVYLLATLAVSCILTLVSGKVSADPLFGGFALVVPTYTVAAWLPRRRAALAFAIWTCGAAVHVAYDHNPGGRFIGGLVAAVVVFAAGRLSRSQRILAAELETRNAELAAQRDQRARVAVIDERIRIARDLHMLIAQTITAMVVQAVSARELLRSDHVRAYAAAAQVERSGRDVLARMRRVLGVLRADRSMSLQSSPDETVAPPSMVPA